MEPKEVLRALKDNNYVLEGDRIAVLLDTMSDTIGNGILYRATGHEYQPSIGEVVAVGSDYTGDSLTGDRVWFNNYNKITFAFDTDQGDFELVVLYRSDVYWRQS